MQDGFEPAPRRRVAEDQRPQPPAVDGAAGIQNPRPEVRGHLGRPRRVGQQLVDRGIAVEDLDTGIVSGEKRNKEAFSGGDAAGEAGGDHGEKARGEGWRLRPLDQGHRNVPRDANLI